MIWLARYCERMTKESKEKERIAQEAKNPQAQAVIAQNKINLTPPSVNSMQPTMSGFLKK